MKRICLFLIATAFSVSHLIAEPVALIRPGDTFDMRLTGAPPDVIAELGNLQFTVGQDGSVNIPLIGKLKVSGLTSSQVEDAVQNKYIADKIFTKPTVIINLMQGARFVSVSGGVRAPQRMPWTSDLTLSSAIGGAQGVSDFANPKQIRLIREGKIEGIYNLKVLQQDPSKDPKLLPGDQVLVPE
jgi:polysaccharide export outer membrane protein